MKKFFKANLIAILLLLAGTICANAQNVGDVINKTVYTDIIASINDYKYCLI